MYHALLTRKYLTTKVIPLLSVLAVMLCTAMVLVTWSVMGGFLTMLLSKGQTLVGDVSIVWPTVGFGHYEDLVKRLEAEKDRVAAATPVIEAVGGVERTAGPVEYVQLRGIDAESYARVVDFERTLWWRALENPLPKDTARRDPRLCEVPLERVAGEVKLGGYGLPSLLLSKTSEETPEFKAALRNPDAAAVKAVIDGLNRAVLTRALANGLSMTVTDPVTGRESPAVVPGIEMLGGSKREPQGYYVPEDTGKPRVDGGVTVDRDFATDRRLVLRVLPFDKNGRPQGQPVARILPVANEYRTEIFEYDRRSMLVELKTLQSMLQMDQAVRIEGAPGGGVKTGPGGKESFEVPQTGAVDPARVTTVLVKAVPGVTPDELKERCEQVYEQFAAAHNKPGQRAEVPYPGTLKASRLIQTWAERNEQMVSAVQHETVIVLMMLTFISVCATFLILAIFWAMVAEKTRDIGVLRAIGASRLGIAWLWLRYGLVIGVVGSLLGFALSYTVVTNVNEIHDWMGRSLGIYVWNPKVYYFSRIPSEIVWARVAVVMGGGAIFSLIGALIPALRAAFMDPVRALRFE